MTSAGKEGVWRGELKAAQEAYKQVAAVEERQKHRIAARDVALDACMRALPEAKALILRLEMSEELMKASKNKLDPITGVISLINRAIREIETARDS